MITLSVQNLMYSYRNKYQTVEAVKDVTCILRPGCFHALIGKSGSGKTTLLSLMAGLERPQGGKILVNDEDLQAMDRDLYRRDQASVIYQNYNLFPLMTVQENVMYPLLMQKKPKPEAGRRAQEVLEKVGLGEEYLKRLPAMLSGGEQQRVAIARALAIGAQLILADEPTGNLDSENSRQIIELLHALAHEENCCVLVVTHDGEIARTADVVFRMDSGRLTEETP
ncbi:MAG: ABC transporter ATP-binding protein [Acetatifactor sp.]|nr:ABC transporter ATP-binding protein [Acetatifactor sp.]